MKYFCLCLCDLLHDLNLILNANVWQELVMVVDCPNPLCGNVIEVYMGGEENPWQNQTLMSGFGSKRLFLNSRIA